MPAAPARTRRTRARVRGVRSRTSWTISRVRLRIGSGFGPCALRLCAERLGPIAEAVIMKAPCNARRVALGFMLRHSIAIEDEWMPEWNFQHLTEQN